MDLTNAQWKRIEHLIPARHRGPNGSGRPPRSPRKVLSGILWILRTGAPWADLPSEYPSYQTCHRRFQEWIKSGVLVSILQSLWDDLIEDGGLEYVESYIDGTYVPAKKGARALGNRGPVTRPRSWRSQTAMVFHCLSLLMQETGTMLFSPSERSTLHSWMNSRKS